MNMKINKFRILSKCGKIRLRKVLYMDLFYAVCVATTCLSRNVSYEFAAPKVSQTEQQVYHKKQSLVAKFFTENFFLTHFIPLVLFYTF